MALAKEIGLQRVLIVYEKAGLYNEALQAVKNTEFSSRGPLYKALLTLSSSSFEFSLPEPDFVPKGKKNEETHELSEEEQFFKNLPSLTLKPLTCYNGNFVQLPPDNAPYAPAPYHQEDPSSWFFSRVFVNITSSLTTDAIKKYLPALLTIIGLSGSGYYAVQQEQEREISAASVSVYLNADCPLKETPEGKKRAHAAVHTHEAYPLKVQEYHVNDTKRKKE